MYTEYDDDELYPHSESRFDKIIDAILDCFETFVISMFVLLFATTFLFKPVDVVGPSMENTLYNNDKLVLVTLFYTPRQGDIVVAQSKALDKTIIKRVIATGGQTVVIDYNENTVTVDGKLLNEEYLGGRLMTDIGTYEQNNSSSGVYTYVVPEGEVFLLGDNRNHSTDSRYIGCLSEDEILGKVVFRYNSDYAPIGRVK